MSLRLGGLEAAREGEDRAPQNRGRQGLEEEERVPGDHPFGEDERVKKRPYGQFARGQDEDEDEVTEER